MKGLLQTGSCGEVAGSKTRRTNMEQAQRDAGEREQKLTGSVRVWFVVASIVESNQCD